MPAPEGEEAEAADQAPAETPLSPEHQRAYDALSNNDLEGAEEAYREALKNAPADQEAKAGLANVGLMRRLANKDAGSIRQDGGANPTSVDAQLLVADLDVAGGHLEDAFRRVLGLYPTVDQEGQELLRQRLLEYFDIAGPTHPAVLSARQALGVRDALWHPGFVFQARIVILEGGDHREDRLAFLVGLDSARGERATIVNSVHGKSDVIGNVSGTEKVAVK
jgi:hypothetical protein